MKNKQQEPLTYFAFSSMNCTECNVHWREQFVSSYFVHKGESLCYRHFKERSTISTTVLILQWIWVAIRNFPRYRLAGLKKNAWLRVVFLRTGHCLCFKNPRGLMGKELQAYER